MDYLKGITPMAWKDNPQYEIDAEGNIISHGKVITGTRFVYADGSEIVVAPRPLEVIAFHNEQIKKNQHYVLSDDLVPFPSGIVRVEAVFKE